MAEKTLLDDLKQRFPAKIKEAFETAGDDVVVIDRESLLGLMTALKGKPFEFTMLLDITCVDFAAESPRFEMVYHLFSLPNKRRLRIKSRLTEDDAAIDSLVPLWKNANWLEREVFDMFGVRFNGHPDLRRLLMYDGFEGYPLRKDYPLRKRQPIVEMRK